MLAILSNLFFNLRNLLNSDLPSIEDSRLIIAQSKDHMYV